MLVFPRKNTRIHKKKVEIHELFVSAPFLVWFAGGFVCRVTPDFWLVTKVSTEFWGGGGGARACLLRTGFFSCSECPMYCWAQCFGVSFNQPEIFQTEMFSWTSARHVRATCLFFQDLEGLRVSFWPDVRRDVRPQTYSLRPPNLRCFNAKRLWPQGCGDGRDHLGPS